LLLAAATEEAEEGIQNLLSLGRKSVSFDLNTCFFQRPWDLFKIYESLRPIRRVQVLRADCTTIYDGFSRMIWLAESKLLLTPIIWTYFIFQRK
jgi:hypothetical protein